MKNILIGLILTTIIMPSCNLKETRENNGEDLKKARAFVTTFFESIKNNDQKKTFKLFGGELTELDAETTFKNVASHLGSLLSYKEEFGNSRVEVRNGKTNERYEFQYDATYEKGITKEKIILSSENGALKIIGYNPIMPTTN